MSNKQLQ